MSLFKQSYIITIKDLENICKQYGYTDILDNLNLREVLFNDDYRNDCAKIVDFSNEAIDNVCDDMEDLLRCEEYELYKELIDYLTVLKALKWYCFDNRIDATSVWVDVTW